ncbi:MAG: M56 family metallopeptidase [Lachnospiraceae bacterium]|nr:M56 family metallopeptidase [Lachnospiraceae bacterium]
MVSVLIILLALVLLTFLFLYALGCNMVMIFFEIGLLVLLLSMVRILFGRHIRASVMYALWGLVPLQFIFSFFFTMGLRKPFLAQSFQEGDIMPVKINLAALHIPWWLFGIWFFGSLAVYAWLSYVNEKFRRQLFDTRITLPVPAPWPVYQVPGLSSSCVMRVKGKKGIYLTERTAADEEKLPYVLAHEISHLKRHDMFWGKIRCAVLVLNWFNPFIWLAVFWSKQDEEMACDERAIRKLGEHERDAYGRVLVEMIEQAGDGQRIFHLSTTMAAGKREMGKRIRRIAGRPKSKLLSVLVLFLTVLVMCGMTSLAAGNRVSLSTPQETVQQYLYYWNQDYPEGMAELRVHGEILSTRDTISLLSCQDVTDEKPVQGEYLEEEDREEWETGAYYDKCRLRLGIERGNLDYDEEKNRIMNETEKSREIFWLIRTSEESDWQILASTMDAGRFK